MELPPEAMKILEDVHKRTATQRERLEFLRKELSKPEIIAIPSVADAYGMEMQKILKYIEQESYSAGAKIDAICGMEYMENEDPLQTKSH